MMHQYLTRSAGVALAMALMPAAGAQLASPVAASDQTSAGTAARSQSSIAVPASAPSPSFAPAVIEGPAPDPQDIGPVQATNAKKDGVPVPPTPPSEFELYASNVAGKPLRRFGSDLLLPDARDFTAPATTAVPPDYLLNPGDQLQLNLSGSVQAAGVRLTIDSEGRIFVPRVGAVMVGGVRYGDVRNVISRAVSRQYRNFEIGVSVARLHGITVYVTGFARHPGAYSVSSLSTLVNAVLAAGGPTGGGSFRSIQLKRGGRLVSDFDLYDLLLKGDKTGDAALQNGDVIHITPAGEQVAVIGSVNNQAIFELAPRETLADAIAYAGGVNTVADDSRLLVLDALGRKVGWQQLTADEARGRRAQRGDIIRVLSDVGLNRPIAEQPVLVTISGEVAKPGRYYVAPGTRLADVVTQAGGLTHDAFPYASVITRQSVKAQQRESFRRALDDLETSLRTQPLVSVNRALPSNDALINSVVQKMREREPSGRLVFNLPVTARALPDDLVVENNDTIEVPTRPVTIGVFGSVASPASFAYREGMSIGDAVRMAGGAQKLADKNGIFVVRANGTVIADRGRTLKEPALPGDLVFVPINATRGEFWARLRDIWGSLFGGVVGAASVAALVK